MYSPEHSEAGRRWYSILGAWLLLLTLAPTGAWAQQYSILVFGDSLSAAYGIPQEKGWVSLLQERLNEKDGTFQVTNASISGETTDGGLRRLPDTLERVRPDLVILELGGNDGLRGFPLPVIEQNLNTMIDAIRHSGAQVLLVGIRIPPNYGTRYAEGFFKIYQRLAKQQNVPAVPFMLEEVAVHPELMQTDGIHPTADAQPQVLNNIWPHLEPLLKPEQKPAVTTDRSATQKQSS